MKILSTKKLKGNQRDLLLGAGFTLVDYDAIGIEFLNFTMPPTVQHAIFTSQNGVQSILNTQFNIEKCFCVGQKTEALLNKNGLYVVKTAQNSEELGDFITKNHKNASFYYFCGSKRRDELPDLLKNSKIELFEVETYKTELKSRKFEQKWDGILFFSPSGVESFTLKNDIANATAFCIGNTTAAAAQKYTPDVVISNSTSIESVIAKAVKTLKSERYL
jgi:uroporphyrinogen-III synthase